MANGKRHDLDEISKAIIAQLQQDGRRSYASIGKAVGLSEAAVRQRVQRLTEGGVMQIVAVTDPLQLGFARQAMVGIRVTGALEPVADALSEIERGRLRRADRRQLRPARRGGLRERRAPAGDHLPARSAASRASPAPRPSSTSSCASRPTRGECAERAQRRTTPCRSGTRAPTRTGRRGRPCPGDLDVDVAVVGAGYTGLWTAYYLAEADPSLSIAVLESEVAGFGASGRNGGWCSALFPAELPALAALGGREAALAQHAAMRATVDEVARVAGAEGIDAHVAKGGTIRLARGAAQLARARAEVEEARHWGRDADDLALLDAAEATGIVRAEGVAGRDVHPRLRGHPSRRGWCAGWRGRPNAAA